MEKITFIIPCYNEINHTITGVSSILENSPLDKINFVFIDNASSDGTYEYVRKVPNSHIIRNSTNNFVNPAWNQGFQHVLEHDLGDYVCLCNNDILASPRWLEPIFELFRTREDQFYAPQSNTQEEPAFTDLNGFREYSRLSWERPLDLRPITQSVIGFCFFFRKEHIKHFYPIPEQLKVLRGDDWLIDCLFFKSVIPFRVSRCAMYHFGGTTQCKMPIDDVRNRDSEEFERLLKTEYKKRGMLRIFDRVPGKILL